MMEYIAYKFEGEDFSTTIDCENETEALAVAKEDKLKYIGLATKEDLNDKCKICTFNYDVMHLDECPNCGAET